MKDLIVFVVSITIINLIIAVVGLHTLHELTEAREELNRIYIERETPLYDTLSVSETEVIISIEK